LQSDVESPALYSVKCICLGRSQGDYRRKGFGGASAISAMPTTIRAGTSPGMPVLGGALQYLRHHDARMNKGSPSIPSMATD